MEKRNGDELRKLVPADMELLDPMELEQGEPVDYEEDSPTDPVVQKSKRVEPQDNPADKDRQPISWQAWKGPAEERPHSEDKKSEKTEARDKSKSKDVEKPRSKDSKRTDGKPVGRPEEKTRGKNEGKDEREKRPRAEKPPPRRIEDSRERQQRPKRVVERRRDDRSPTRGHYKDSKYVIHISRSPRRRSPPPREYRRSPQRRSPPHSQRRVSRSPSRNGPYHRPESERRFLLSHKPYREPSPPARQSEWRSPPRLAPEEESLWGPPPSMYPRPDYEVERRLPEPRQHLMPRDPGYALTELDRLAELEHRRRVELEMIQRERRELEMGLSTVPYYPNSPIDTSAPLYRPDDPRAQQWGYDRPFPGAEPMADSFDGPSHTEPQQTGRPVYPDIVLRSEARSRREDLEASDLAPPSKRPRSSHALESKHPQDKVRGVDKNAVVLAADKKASTTSKGTASKSHRGGGGKSVKGDEKSSSKAKARVKDTAASKKAETGNDKASKPAAGEGSRSKASASKAGDSKAASLAKEGQLLPVREDRGPAKRDVARDREPGTKAAASGSDPDRKPLTRDRSQSDHKHSSKAPERHNQLKSKTAEAKGSLNSGTKTSETKAKERLPPKSDARTDVKARDSKSALKVSKPEGESRHSSRKDTQAGSGRAESKPGATHLTSSQSKSVSAQGKPPRANSHRAETVGADGKSASRGGGRADEKVAKDKLKEGTREPPKPDKADGRSAAASRTARSAPAKPTSLPGERLQQSGEKSQIQRPQGSAEKSRLRRTTSKDDWKPGGRADSRSSRDAEPFSGRPHSGLESRGNGGPTRSVLPETASPARFRDPYQEAALGPLPGLPGDGFDTRGRAFEGDPGLPLPPQGSHQHGMMPSMEPLPLPDLPMPGFGPMYGNPSHRVQDPLLPLPDMAPLDHNSYMSSHRAGGPGFQTGHSNSPDMPYPDLPANHGRYANPMEFKGRGLPADLASGKSTERPRYADRHQQQGQPRHGMPSPYQDSIPNSVGLQQHRQLPGPPALPQASPYAGSNGTPDNAPAPGYPPRLRSGVQLGGPAMSMPPNLNSRSGGHAPPYARSQQGPEGNRRVAGLRTSHEDEVRSQWYYMDPQGIVQGPASKKQLGIWLDQLSAANDNSRYQAFCRVHVWREGMRQSESIELLRLLNDGYLL